MDLTQRRLNRAEWESIEVPVSPEEKRVGQLLLEGAHTPSIRRNRAVSLASYLQIERGPATSAHFWDKYLLPELSVGKDGCPRSAPIANGFAISLKKKTRAPALRAADRIRLRNADRSLASPEKRERIFEFVLIDLIKEVHHSRINGAGEEWLKPYYALRTLRTRAVSGVHETLLAGLDDMIRELDASVQVESLVFDAARVIEQNTALLQHADDQLFSHQRSLLEACCGETERPASLILLTAPTGTGKTVAPVGLSQRKRVVFVCAARHVGLALAKLAVSLEKKVAFAFGCDSDKDIRLHYYAASDCIRDRRSGRIVKVDNSAGENVEIMVCDVRSCTIASDYMLKFNDARDIVLYWDEPTIALDYDDHPCHTVIQGAWRGNRIPTVVLSSATLPDEDELAPTINGFKSRFPGAEVVAISSHECRKSIPLFGRDGDLIMPHDLSRDSKGGRPSDAIEAANRALENKTLLRHLDLASAARFLKASAEVSGEAAASLESAFPTVDSVTAESVKCFYLRCVQQVAASPSTLAAVLRRIGCPSKKSNIRLMTRDAHTLTDGPAIFLADNVDAIAKFCIRDASLPANVLDGVGKSIAHNEELRRRISIMQMEYENGTQKDEGKGRQRRLAAEKMDPAMRRIARSMDALRTMIRPAAVGPQYIPNTPEHKKRYAEGQNTRASFAPDISEKAVEDAMLVDGVDDKWKLLLLLGVGVFAPWNSPSYTELMKSLANAQKLFMVVATSDYIYGTNYQFCHGYIAKDLGGMSQEKCIQAMGRVGRNRIQQTYSIRFRDDALIRRLFTREADRPEVANMAKLFAF